jgi:hypothetical protein
MEGLLIIIKLLNNPFILKNRLNDFIWIFIFFNSNKIWTKNVPF